jgi:hypothetical protein
MCNPRIESGRTQTLRTRGSQPRGLVLLLADSAFLLDVAGRLRLGTLVTGRLRFLALMTRGLRLGALVTRRLRLLALVAGRSRILALMAGRSRILTLVTRRSRLLALGESGPRGDQQADRGGGEEDFSKHFDLLVD